MIEKSKHMTHTQENTSSTPGEQEVAIWLPPDLEYA